VKLYRTAAGIFVENDGRFFRLDVDNWDELLRLPELYQRAAEFCRGVEVAAVDAASILSPIGSQEVWAAGVTYYRSRNARMEESKDAGGGSFYDRVYSAERPELFFKANGAKVAGHGGKVRIRSDAKWSVPEPELTLVISAAAEIVGYTIGNDMSSRDIEGENPLYLPQAKVYDGSCALGPCVLLAQGALPKSTEIRIEIVREEREVFSGSTSLAELKRDPEELVRYLYRESSFPQGAYLMTGTGVVPGDDFTLLIGDLIRIRIGEIGTLENLVA
jgi:2-dehydro-3-deoxy-D-arabinonate dehydratase